MLVCVCVCVCVCVRARVGVCVYMCESVCVFLPVSIILYKYIIPERLWLNLWALRFLPLYYFLRGAAPKKIVGSGRNRRPIDSTGASKKGMIYLFYIPHQQHLWKLPVTFTFLCWSLSS